MTHLDIIVNTLSEVSNLPAAHFRQTILGGIELSGKDASNYTELLRELSDEEANHHLAALRTPAAKQGVLAWLVQSAVDARKATPTQRHTLTAFMNHQQN
jgi:hypothetical protein